MAGVKDVVVRAQALDGTWDVLGANAARGVFPENAVLEADGWGPSRASFNLRRDPARPWPDIGAFTPVEIEVGGMLVWDGRVQETPSQVAERVINVQCEGWQFHLDDDVYERPYVHNDLTAWKDTRTFLDAPLGMAAGKFYAAGQATADNGAATLTVPSGTTVTQFADIGITLDLGPGQTAAAISYDYDCSNNDVNFTCFVQGHDGHDPQAGSGASENVSSFALNGGAAATFDGTFATPRRYISFVLQRQAATGAPAADVWVRLRGVRVFTATAYRSSSQSILKASDVVLDALTRATVLLSADRSGVQATSLNIPTFTPGEPITARQAWERVDAYHNWVKQIAVGRRVIYKPMPSAPIIEVGNWSAATDEDASANSGENIYNGAVITGQTPDGQPARVARGSGQAVASGRLAITDPAPANPSFDTNTTGWSVSGGGAGTITRDATTFDTTPASGKFNPTTYPIALVGALNGKFLASITYTLQFAAKFTTGGSSYFAGFGVFGLGSSDPAPIDASVVNLTLTGSFAVYEVTWTPAADTSSAQFVLYPPNFVGSMLAWVDTLAPFKQVPTLVDRRGFRRRKILPISNALPPDNVAANVITDTWLSGHKTTPFKGANTLVGNGAARDILTGEDIPPERLLLRTMELVRFSDRPDPDTGGHGRDGRIVGVSYSAATDTAQVTIDNTRQNFESLMARLDLLSG
jgi:hypothetical protein